MTWQFHNVSDTVVTCQSDLHWAKCCFIFQMKYLFCSFFLASWLKFKANNIFLFLMFCCFDFLSVCLYSENQPAVRRQSDVRGWLPHVPSHPVDSSNSWRVHHFDLWNTVLCTGLVKLGLRKCVFGSVETWRTASVVSLRSCLWDVHVRFPLRFLLKTPPRVFSPSDSRISNQTPFTSLKFAASIIKRANTGATGAGMWPRGHQRTVSSTTRLFSRRKITLESVWTKVFV